MRINRLALDARHLILAMLLAIAGSVAANAQQPTLTYEDLSILKEPLAVEMGDVTYTLEGIVEAPYAFNRRAIDEGEAGFHGGFRLGALTQLPNSARLAAYYVGEYDRTEGSDEYEDRFSLSLNNAYGTLSAGNVSDFLYDEIGRRIKTGNADLGFERTYGAIGEYALNYAAIAGPVVWGGTVDRDGYFDAGVLYQRPLDELDYRLGLRYINGRFEPGSSFTEMRTHSVEGVAELTYGSSMVDAGFLYEQMNSSQLSDIERWGFSSGFRTKTGALTWSIEGHYGQTEGQEEISLAFGARYDVARGMSVNVGVNYQDAQILLNGNNFVAADNTRTRISLRYEF